MSKAAKMTQAEYNRRIMAYSYEDKLTRFILHLEVAVGMADELGAVDHVEELRSLMEDAKTELAERVT